MGLLGFLKTATIEEVAKPTRTGGGVKLQRNPPKGLTIRVWKDGSLYPSQAAVDKFDLEYKKGTPVKEEVKDKIMDGLKAAGAEVDAPKMKVSFLIDGFEGNGFDVIDSAQWVQFKAEGRLLFISPVPKDQPKVDLFGNVRRDDETGEAESVLEQGAATFGAKTLIPLLKEVYGIDLTDENKFVDLEILDIVEGINVTEMFSKELSFFPKVVARGAEKGQPDYIKRENAKVYAFVPAAVETEVTKKAETSITELKA